MTTRIGVDVGGTFTDLVFYDESSGEIRVAKVPSTPLEPDRGVLDAVDAAVDAAGISRAEFFLHGTTVGINALLERNGAEVGLITTDGFRDILEIRRGVREAAYDATWTAPDPLVARSRRVEVRERILADGTVDTPLALDDVAVALEELLKQGAESIAVILINSYVNADHENKVAAELRRLGFEGGISLSHQVTGEYGEYERSSTTVIDAYVRPRVSDYVQRLADGLREHGFKGQFLVTRSGGGALTFEDAQSRPFETIMSGPVAGVGGSADLCRRRGIRRGVTADVGGTSFDTSLIVGGRPIVKYQGEVADLPLQTPWVDVQSIGAGGGSVAHVDAGLLKVGPRSAGAAPGPICYSRGGTEPTVTDAAAVLGMLGFGELAGNLRLDIGGAADAIATLGNSLGLGLDETAQGIVAIANAAMAGAIREITVAAGEDPREASLIAFGGAGPLFATLLARELGIREVLIPTAAGNFSAWGLLTQDVTRSAARTLLAPAARAGLVAANEVLAGLFSDLVDELESDWVLESALDLRYRGQAHTLTLSLPTMDGTVSADADDLRARFATEYERTFGHAHDSPLELVTVRASVRRPLPVRGTEITTESARADQRTLDAYSFTRDQRTCFKVVWRGSLSPGEELDGPLILLEETTTTYVDDGFVLSVDDGGVIVLRDVAADRADSTAPTQIGDLT